MLGKQFAQCRHPLPAPPDDAALPAVQPPHGIGWRACLGSFRRVEGAASGRHNAPGIAVEVQHRPSDRRDAAVQPEYVHG
jgi:hypothetical protein